MLTQPSASERAKVITHLTEKIASAQAALRDSGGHSVLRRLNSWEYRQTIGDLLGLNVEVWDPAENFPAEVKVDGFDNNGKGLVTSGMLMDHYFAAAEEAIRRATQFGERPERKQYTQQSPFYFDGKAVRAIFRSSSRLTDFDLCRRHRTPICTAGIIAAGTSDSCHWFDREAWPTAACTPSGFEPQPSGACMSMERHWVTFEMEIRW